MATQGFGRFYSLSKAKTKVVLYIPAELRRDSSYPFKDGDRARIRIVGRKLVVEPAK